MLGRTVSSPSRPAGLSLTSPLQLAVLALITAGALSLALTQAPVAASAGHAALGGRSFCPVVVLMGLGCETLGVLDPAQGLAPTAPTSLGWLNPGADLDASVSTDGEDIAAPVADIAEFRSKDSFLAVDALFGGAAAANAAAAGGAAVLATALAQDTL
jgi:hypothetical protein